MMLRDVPQITSITTVPSFILMKGSEVAQASACALLSLKKPPAKAGATGIRYQTCVRDVLVSSKGICGTGHQVQLGCLILTSPPS